jgi:hypothetical protein
MCVTSFNVPGDLLVMYLVIQMMILLKETRRRRKAHNQIKSIHSILPDLVGLGAYAVKQFTTVINTIRW